MPNLPSVATVVAASLITLLTACGDDTRDEPGDVPGEDVAPGPTEPEEPAAAEPAGWDVAEEPSDAPAAIETEPLWGPDEGPMPVVSGATFRDDAVVLWGGDEGNRANRLAVADAETGETRWMTEVLEDLPGAEGAAMWGASDSPLTPTVVEREDDWVVLMDYIGEGVECSECEHGLTSDYGIAALSGETGEVVWRTQVLPDSPVSDRDIDGTIRSMVADPGTVVAMVEPDDLNYVPFGREYLQGVSVVALDAADGSPRWHVPGFSPTEVAGTTVFGHQITDEDEESAVAGRQPGSVVAVDAATGDVRWDLSGEYPASQLVATAGDLAVVEVVVSGQPSATPEELTELLVVEAETGEQVDSFGRTSHGVQACASDGEDLITCAVEDDEGHKLASYRVADRAGAVSPQVIPSRFVGGVHQDLAFVGGVNEETGTVDASGNVVQGSLPGEYVAAGEGYVLFEHPGIDFGPYSVHRIGG